MKRNNLWTLLLAGSLFFCCGAARGTVKEGVTVGGVAVGGMNYADAVRAVREEAGRTLPPLVVHTPAGDFVARYPELSFTDNAEELVRQAKKGERLSLTVRREWADMEERLLFLCEQNARPARDAELLFSPAGFRYRAGAEGAACDYRKLLADVTRALKEGGEATLALLPVRPQTTEQDLRARTRPLSSFSTAFDPSNVSRAHNVRLAAARIGGTTVGAGEEFSFNGRVGKRTKENGFAEATVILQGEFVQGVGGGVCQTSTTLLGAAVRAGMRVTQSRPHSLTVSYVPPSQDAMVSEFSDLKFVNPYPYPVYILARTGRDSVGFEFYGMPCGRRYEFESVTLGRISPPPELVVEGETEETLRAAKEGLKSESWILEYDGDGNLLSRTLFRRDAYAPVQGIRQEPPALFGQISPP